MQLNFNQYCVSSYSSNSQKIRVMSETWTLSNIYCVKCGNVLSKFENNNPAGDFFCSSCDEEYELKSNKAKITNNIVDGSYSVMIDKIESGKMPNIFVLNYSIENYNVNNFFVIPRYYFSKDIIIKRKPLSENAKRAGWVGCNINIGKIPSIGRLYILKNGYEQNKNYIIHSFNRMIFINEQKSKSKTWLMDILRCIESLNKKVFSLQEIYKFENTLKQLHPQNNNIKEKIRQQLQILRNNGYLNFTSRGEYTII